MPYWMVQTGTEGPGIDGGLMPRQQPGLAPVNTIDVPSCDDFVRKIEAAGGTAYCLDPEGNMFGIMESNPEAGS